MYKPRFGTRFQRFGASTLVMLSPSPRINYNMGEREIGWKTVEVIPTCHLVLRCRERLGDLAPDFEIGRPSPWAGALGKEGGGGGSLRSYLEVVGMGDSALVRVQEESVGLSTPPQSHS